MPCRWCLQLQDLTADALSMCRQRRRLLLFLVLLTMITTVGCDWKACQLSRTNRATYTPATHSAIHCFGQFLWIGDAAKVVVALDSAIAAVFAHSHGPVSDLIASTRTHARTEGRAIRCGFSPC